MSGRTRRLRVGACLSLTGRHARFGVQAARGLEVWRGLDGAADVVIQDDCSDPRTLEARLPEVARVCDVLLGPYSTNLMRVAGRMAADADWLLWNHGGSGDDVETAHPGHVVSVLTPTSRYATPFIRRLALLPERAPLLAVHGRGSFGRQVVDGAQTIAGHAGLDVRLGDLDGFPWPLDGAPVWDLFLAGSFEEDVRGVVAARSLPHPPRAVCAVAAGVQEFGAAVGNRKKVFGVGQWFPGTGHKASIGPSEHEFLTAYGKLSAEPADYPAVQAAATAALAAHCARQVGTADREALWAAAAGLDTRTLFGPFRIDTVTGLQLGHEAVLVRWTSTGLAAADSDG